MALQRNRIRLDKFWESLNVIEKFELNEREINLQ